MALVINFMAVGKLVLHLGRAKSRRQSGARVRLVVVKVGSLPVMTTATVSKNYGTVPIAHRGGVL